jgi:hypothetical protein
MPVPVPARTPTRSWSACSAVAAVWLSTSTVEVVIT